MAPSSPIRKGVIITRLPTAFQQSDVLEFQAKCSLERVPGAATGPPLNAILAFNHVLSLPLALLSTFASSVAAFKFFAFKVAGNIISLLPGNDSDT